ncbi:MAG: hypothetical protein ACK2UQ_08835, partial [Anaerolineae bacterium]
NEFLDLYFNRMMEHGRFFIVLDSFDEIPAVLDTDNSSELIDKLSDVLYRFLAGSHESRGILASRIFRKPTQSFQAGTTLELRPFTESKIIETFNKSLLDNSEDFTKFFHLCRCCNAYYTGFCQKRNELLCRTVLKKR